MKKYYNIYLWIFCFFIGIQANAQQAIFLKYNANCMDKYYYQINDFSNYQYLLSYQVKIAEHQRAILNVSQMDSKQVDEVTYNNAQPCNSIEFTNMLMRTINNKKQELFVVAPNKNGYGAYKIETAIYAEFSEYYLNYSGPFYSFFFDKNKTYASAEYLEEGMFIDYGEANYMYNKKGEEACKKTFNLVKLIRATHADKSFGLISKADYNKLSENHKIQIAQKPLYVDIVEGIGIVKETTANGSYELLSINGQPLKKYLVNQCGLDPTTAENQLKGEEIESIEKIVHSSLEGHTSDLGYKSKPVFKKQPKINGTPKGAAKVDISDRVEKDNAIKDKINNSENVSKGVDSKPTNRKIHVVDNGENLYRIAKKYKMTIEELKALNNLENESIYVTQELFVK